MIRLEGIAKPEKPAVDCTRWPRPASHGAAKRRGRRQRQAGPWGRRDERATPRKPPPLRLAEGTSDPTGWFFFAPRQSPLETAPVEGNSIVFLDGSNALDGGQPRFCRPQACYVVENFGRHLVPTLWTTLTGQQAGQASPIEGCLCLIKGGPRDPKSGRRIENRHSFGAVPPQHLVTNLEKILGIEERVLFEQEIGHGFGVWIERAGALEFQRLLAGLSTFGHQDRTKLVCNY